MNSRERIKEIFNLSSTGFTGYWTGIPHEDTEEIYLSDLKCEDMEQVYTYLKDDCRRIAANDGYKHPENKRPFDTRYGMKKEYHSQGGCFAECESLEEVERYEWPNPEYLDYSGVISELRRYKDKSVLTGWWSHFFHIVCDYFGMENYFVKMHTDPLIVEAVTNHVVDFLAEANDRFFGEAGDDADIFFFGNDLGSQIDLLISPENYNKFILPGMKKLINAAKKHNKKVLLHSCGAISKIIPSLIDAGIDALHPLQALAKDMDAKTLAREYKDDLAFVGGIDTQYLLVKGTPQDIKDEVYKLKEILGPNLVVSPSHETLLPNIPIENIIAMSEAARE